MPMRIPPVAMVSLEQKNRFLLERERANERLEDTKHSAEKQLQFTERAFTFGCYVSYWFEKGTLEEKNTVLKTTGSNFFLKDRLSNNNTYC